MKVESVRQVLVNVLLFLLIIIVFGAVGFALYPYNPLTIESFTTDKLKVHRGEKLCYTLKGVKHYEVQASVTVEMINGENKLIMSYDSNMPKGRLMGPCGDGRSRCFIVPYEMIPGRYRVSWTVVYPMNSLNSVRLNTLSPWIEVK